MSARHLLDALQENRPVFGTALRTGDPAIVEIVAIAGYDWVSITLEHSTLSVADIGLLQRAADARAITTLIHMPRPDDPRILQLLDDGVGGIVGCNVESGEEAAAWVRACRFPPLGERGAAGVVRRADYGAIPFGQFTAQADAEVAVGVVIETVAGVERAAEIIATPGITFAYVGLHDLTLSLGCPGDFRDPRALAAVERVIALAHEHDVVVGLSEKGYTARELWDLGVRMLITPTGEYAVLMEGYRAKIDAARASIGEVREVHGAL